MDAQAPSAEQLAPAAPAHHTRSHSDTKLHIQPQLSPSPKFKEPAPKVSRDDNVIISTPSKLPGRPHREALVLQMPPRDQGSCVPGIPSGRSTPMHSPQVERENNFESPTSMLPRHSRGLDFSRACTNLHHSTLPDQSSPDSSPKVSHRALKIPSRRQSTVSNMVLDSPRTSGSGNFWGDKAFRPRSLGSTTAMTSEASSSDSDSDDEMKSRYDPDDVLTTPVMHRQSHSIGGITPYGLREDTVTGGALHNPSPISRRYTPYRRNTRGGGRVAALRNQHTSVAEENNSSSSVTPDPNEMPIDQPLRRDSISAVTSSLQLSANSNSNSQDSDTETSPATFKFQSPQVVRRPVTRRSNLLPKTKGFARIRAQLQEESSPIDSDMRRDAEVVRQVRVGSGSNNFIPNLSHHSTAESSPDLTPTALPHHPMDGTDIGDLEGLGVTLPTTEGATHTPTTTASSASDEHFRRTSSKGDIFSHLFGPNRLATPPPLFGSVRHRSSSGAMSEDNRTESPAPISQTSSNTVTNHPRADSETGNEPFPFAAPNMPSAAEVTRKANAKRRRDDDFDPASIKRRAVSPGMSVHSSPVLGQSPVSTTSGWWGKGKESREGSGGTASRENSQSEVMRNSQSEANRTSQGDAVRSQIEVNREGRSASTGSVSGSIMAPPSTPSLGARRVGLQQGMSDTSDGLVKMSLE